MAPAFADAAVTCNYEAGAEVLQVTMAVNGDQAAVSFDKKGKIVVRDTSTNIACTGGSSFLSNTGDITVTDSAPGNSNTHLTVADPGGFAETTKFIYAPGKGGEDVLTLVGSSHADNYRLGSEGLDADVDHDLDVVFLFNTPDTILAELGGGDDSIRAEGDFGTGEALPDSVSTEFVGGEGADTMNGGEGIDVLVGGPGNDFIDGHGGKDILVPDEGDAGNDFVVGGPGVDGVTYESATHPVTVELAADSETGEGGDQLVEIENVYGSPQDDQLSAGADPARLYGREGNDTIEGREGDDHLEGGPGEDTISFAAASAGVSVDLKAGSSSGAESGKDVLTEFEDIVGSDFNDVLDGDEGGNKIDARDGFDLVQALGGDDTILIRDEVFSDHASCGAGVDRVIADRPSLDTVDPDCEKVDASAELSIPGGAGSGPQGPLQLNLTIAKVQNLAKQKAVVLSAQCPAEGCLITVAGASKHPALKLRSTTRFLEAGVEAKLKLSVGAGQRRRLESTIAAGRKPKIQLLVTAEGVSRAKAQRALTVTAKRA